MGYRSENILCMKQTTYKKMLILGTNTSSLFNEHFEKTYHAKDDVLIYFIGRSLKMYSTYSDVEEFYRWLERMDERDYHFLRQGEDHDDNESLGKLYQTEDTEMFLEASISYPGGSLW